MPGSMPCPRRLAKHSSWDPIRDDVHKQEEIRWVRSQAPKITQKKKRIPSRHTSTNHSVYEFVLEQKDLAMFSIEHALASTECCRSIDG
jgi:hypothetical protein